MDLQDDDHEMEGAYRWPYDFTSKVDFGMGFIIGAYAPVQGRWRNDDCRSKFFKLASMLMGYTKYGDYHPDERTIGDNVGSLIQVTYTGLAMYSTYNTCMDQYDDIQNVDDWTTDFELMALLDEPKSKSSRPTVKDGVVSDTLTGLGLVLSLNSAL